MSWKCLFFRHKWALKAARAVQVFDGENDLPISGHSNFLYQCSTCQTVKVKRVEGLWDWGDDDDDDGDKDRDRYPVTPPPGEEKPKSMTPDEFYELVTKE